MPVERNVSATYYKPSRPEAIQHHLPVDWGPLRSEFDSDSQGTVKPVKIGAAEAENGRIGAASLLEKIKTAHGRDELPVVSYIPYFNPVQDTI